MNARCVGSGWVIRNCWGGCAKKKKRCADKAVTGAFLQKLEHGVTIEGYVTKPATATRTAAQRFRLTITEGKKHQIRRMCAALGYQVQSLKRVQVANIQLGQLKPNQYRKLTKDERAVLFALLNLNQ